MKHCEQCNMDFPTSYRFCGSCGGPLSDSTRCPGCGELTEARWTFCTSCGRQISSGKSTGPDASGEAAKPAEVSAAPLASSSSPAASPSLTETRPSSAQRTEKAPVQEWYAAPELFEETTETTATPIQRQNLVPRTTIAAPRVTTSPQVGNGKTAPTLTMLAAYGEPRAAPPESQRRNGLLVGLLVLIFVGIVGVAGYWLIRRTSIAQSPPQADSTVAPASADTSTPASSASITPTSFGETTRNTTADDEFKRLRERRIGANPSESGALVMALESAEKKYPRDYRFPYERAKLSIKGIASHHEAFGALALAAEKAIDNGKAQDMLDSLMVDKDGDFWKLSRGHREWQALEDALRNKDTAPLKALRH